MTLLNLCIVIMIVEAVQLILVRVLDGGIVFNIAGISMVLSFIAQIIVVALTLVYSAIDIQLVTLPIQMLFPSLFA